MSYSNWNRRTLSWEGPEGTQENGYLLMSELGNSCGLSSHKVGRILKELGYRTEAGKPSKRAFDEKLVAPRFADDRPDVYSWAWRADKVLGILKAMGADTPL